MGVLSDIDLDHAWESLSPRRWLGGAAAMAGLAAVMVMASWLNSLRYHLLVEGDAVRVDKGVLLPLGHRPFVPDQPELAGAYRPLSLPPGLAIARGARVFVDRVALDQALFRVLFDASRHVLEAEAPSVTALRQGEDYLERLARLPGLNAHQRRECETLERRLGFFKARETLAEARRALESARSWLQAARHLPDVGVEAVAMAARTERALAELDGRSSTDSDEGTVDGSHGEPPPTPAEESDPAGSTTSPSPHGGQDVEELAAPSAQGVDEEHSIDHVASGVATEVESKPALDASAPPEPSADTEASPSSPPAQAAAPDEPPPEVGSAETATTVANPR